MTALDQLLYTWAARGPNGQSGFQAVAATGRLADDRSKLTTAALRLCRYEAPRGTRDPAQMPVSYGWQDHGDFRMVFHRRYIGADALGRPGNYAAHIVVGPRAEMPAGDIARRLGSPFWWHGASAADYASGQLAPDQVGLADIPLGSLPGAEPDLLAGLIDTLLRERLRLPVVLRCSAGQLAALVAELAGRLPGCLDALPFSTYESPAAATGFYLVGICGSAIPPNSTAVRAARPQPSPRALELILSDELADRDLVVMSVGASGAVGAPASIARIGPLIVLFDQLRRDGGIDHRLLALGLRRPVAAQILIQMPNAKEAIAADLAAGQAQIHAALGESAGQLPATALLTLGEMAGGQAQPARVVPLMAEAVRLPAPFASACAIAIVERADHLPGLGRLLDSVTVLALLRPYAARYPGRLDPGVATVLRVPAAFPAVALADDLPAAWRGVAAAHALPGGPGVVRDIAGMLRGDPGLTGALAAALPAVRDLIPVLSLHKPRDLVPCAVAAAADLPGSDRYELVAWCAGRLPPSQRLDLLLQARQHISDAPGEPWGGLTASALAGWLTDTLARPDAIPVLPAEAVSLLRGLGAGRTEGWGELAECLLDARSPGHAWQGSAFAAVDAMPASHRPSAVDLVLWAALDADLSDSLFDDLAASCAKRLPADPDKGAVRLLDMADRVALVTGRTGSGAQCLVYLASLLARGGLGTRKARRLRYRSHHAKAAALVARLSDGQWKVVDRKVAMLKTRDATAWWESVNPRPTSMLRRV